jgi:quinol monooxygenase YgiN
MALHSTRCNQGKVTATNPSEINLVASLIALPGKETELRGVLRGLVTPSRNESGCRRYDMYASDHQGKVLAIETWESRQALDEHMQTPHFKEAATKFPELVQGGLTLDFLEPIG